MLGEEAMATGMLVAQPTPRYLLLQRDAVSPGRRHGLSWLPGICCRRIFFIFSFSFSFSFHLDFFFTRMLFFDARIIVRCCRVLCSLGSGRCDDVHGDAPCHKQPPGLYNARAIQTCWAGNVSMAWLLVSREASNCESNTQVLGVLHLS